MMAQGATSLKTRLAVFIGALAAGATVLGCSFGASSQSPMSHFAFPNSNVVPLGSARGSASKLCGLLFVTWGSPDADDQEHATREALEASGGDLLINVRTDSKVFFVPMLISICTTKVRGTACKMEVGRQQLSAMNPGANPPPQAAPPLAPAAAAPPTPASPQPPPVAPARGGCASDADCKTGRICKDRACVNP